MKQYWILGLAALGLTGCFGGKDAALSVDQVAKAPQLYEQAKQAYQSGDTAAAVALLQQLAGENHPDSLYALSVMHRQGDGVPNDEAKANEMLMSAAKAGFAPAQYDLAKLLLQQGKSSEAAPFMQSAAEQGMLPAQFNYGLMQYRGDGVAQDQKNGLALIQSAAKGGFVPAQQALKKFEQKM